MQTPDRQEWEGLATEAHHRGNRARERAAEARERAKQIEESLLASATAGGRVGVSDLESAGRAAVRALESHSRATAAHLSAATGHDLARLALERAALTDPAHAAEHRRRAEQHRALADASRLHAADESSDD